MSDKQRDDTLAAVIHDLRGLFTIDQEAKADFIKALKNVLGSTPDLGGYFSELRRPENGHERF